MVMSDKLPKRTSENRAGKPFAIQSKQKTGRVDLSGTDAVKLQAPGVSWITASDVSIYSIIAISILIVYGQIFSHPFVNYDDAEYLTDPHVMSGLSWANIKWAWTAFAAGNWHPVTWISHAVDFQLFGSHAGGHHAISVLLHFINAALLFFLLRSATNKRWRSFAVAALFALHPLQVESVAWAAERKNLLCTLFFLLALGAYGWYARKPGLGRYLSVAALFALGLASKPMVVTFPLLLVLIDFWPLGRVAGWSHSAGGFYSPQKSIGKLLLEKLPFLAMSAGSAVVTIVAQSRSNAMPSMDTGWTIAWRIQNAIHSYAAYIWKAFFPRGLAVFYPAVQFEPWEVWLSGFFLVLLSVIVWRMRRGRPYLEAGYLWFLITLIPVIGLIQVGAQSMADRYTYIPMIGIFVAAVWLASDLADHLKLTIPVRAGIGAAVLIILAVLAARQAQYWRSSIDLWTHALQVTDGNLIAEEDLALSLMDAGRDEEAFVHLQNAQRIRPNEPSVAIELGNYLVKHKRFSEAGDEYEMAVQTYDRPSQLEAAYAGLGVVYGELGDRAQARQAFLEALKINPADQTSLFNLSMVEVQDGIEKLSYSMAKHPTAEGYLSLGQLLEEDRRPSEAQAAYAKALEINPGFKDAKPALAQLKAKNTSSVASPHGN